MSWPLPRPLFVEDFEFLDVIVAVKDFPFLVLVPITLEALAFLAAILEEDLEAFCSCCLAMMILVLDTS